MNDIARKTILLLALGVAGCAGGGDGGGDGGGGGGGGGGGSTFTPAFQLPTDGATLLSSFQIEVTGTGVVRVFFNIDGNVTEDVAAPFMVEIDPTTFPKGTYRIVVTAQASNGTEEKRIINLNFDHPRTPASVILAAIAALGPGEWYEIPDSHLRDVAWTATDRGDIGGIIGSASGGAYDTKRERMLLFGGGQGGYSGNEIYAFDMPTVSWIRLNDPSPFPPGEEKNPLNRPQHPDGSPVARHTYDYIEYVPEPYDSLVVGGGAALWYDSFRDTKSYTFNLGTLTWKTLPDTPSASLGAVAAVGPDGRYWMQGAQDTSRNHLAVLDLATEMWTKHVTWNGYKVIDQTADIDPVRNLFVATGIEGTYVWDLDTPDADATKLVTTGDVAIEFAKAPGFVYHAGNDVMVAWHGGLVHTLDLDTAVWTAIPPAGTVAAPGAASRGTYGRWRYSPTYDVFIAVNDADTNVFVYRLP
jgi:hypothetical protein